VNDAAQQRHLESVAAQLTLIGMADGPLAQFRGSPLLGLYNHAWQALRGSGGGFDAMNVPF
jgi:hypothetical protein